VRTWAHPGNSGGRYAESDSGKFLERAIPRIQAALAGPTEAHIALEHVPELRNLVKSVRAEEGVHWRDLDRRRLPSRSTICLSVFAHGRNW